MPEILFCGGGEELASGMCTPVLGLLGGAGLAHPGMTSAARLPGPGGSASHPDGRGPRHVGRYGGTQLCALGLL